MANRQVPHVIHVVWIGDESLRPDSCIDSWRSHNPDCAIKVWGNREMQARSWRNARHMAEMWQQELAGVADMMRYEILFDEGGFAIDADSVCQRPLDDFLFDHDPFACWENEISRPGLIANGFIGASAGNPMIKAVIDAIGREQTLKGRMAWQSTGPSRLTETVRKLGYSDLTIFPSHFFIPRHYTGTTYKGPGRIYADHAWSSTQQLIGANASQAH